jgi:hypothetical protein
MPQPGMTPELAAVALAAILQSAPIVVAAWGIDRGMRTSA